MVFQNYALFPHLTVFDNVDVRFQVGQRVQVCWAPASANLLVE